VTISVDSSGEHLHRRGYRFASAKAPLRETLAAGMLLASGWDRRSPLLDPFCGSGTIPIEAAMMANELAPGRQRRFAFMSWPDFDQSLWEQLLKSEHKITAKILLSDNPGAGVDPPAVILGSDRDSGAIAMSEANANRAGVSERIQFSCRAVSAIEPPAGPGWVASNPPYGLRVSHQKDLRNLYAQFGNVLRSKCPDWRFAVLCSDARLFSHSGLHSDSQFSFENGGVPVKLYCGTVSD
jgi:23S rRNA G2445 N2-methylase RlmL